MIKTIKLLQYRTALRTVRCVLELDTAEGETYVARFTSFGSACVDRSANRVADEGARADDPIAS